MPNFTFDINKKFQSRWNFSKLRLYEIILYLIKWLVLALRGFKTDVDMLFMWKFTIYYFCQNCPFNGKSLFFLLIETLEIEKSSCFVGASFSFNYKQKQEKLSCVWKVHGSGFHLRKNTAPHENLMFLSFLSFWGFFLYINRNTHAVRFNH